MIGEKDERGQNSVAYSYNPNTELINTVTLPNGGNYYYNYDAKDRVTKMFAKAGTVENANTTEYYNDDVTKLNHSGNVPITYEYDEKHRLSKIYLNGALYESYAYEDNATDVNVTVDRVTRTYANGHNIMVATDKLQSSKKIYFNRMLRYQYKYDFNTNTALESDRFTGITKKYEYDACGNLITVRNNANNAVLESYSYDSHGRLINDNGCTYKYDGIINEYVSEVTTGPLTITPQIDVNGRYIGRKVKYDEVEILDECVEYLKGIDNRATNIPEKIVFDEIESLSYAYDGNGNITTVKENGVDSVQYGYDTLGRLISERNKALNKNLFYTYDNNGNITSKDETAYNVTAPNASPRYVYTYDTNGRMTSFDGETCSYDSLGNPTTYRDKELQWSYGRRLMKFDGNTFKYDTHGLRIGKNSITFTYDSQGRLLKQSNGLQFIYDNTGLLGFKRGAATYIYRKDIQGNIIAILDSSGAVVVEYFYDAWGNCKVSGSNITLGNLNPFRYRGYYYDTETKLYYLQSRYYDPEVGRFLNMDSLAYADPETINGLNLYSYCNNNPVMYSDPTGTSWWNDFCNGFTNFFNEIGKGLNQFADNIRNLFNFDNSGLKFGEGFGFDISIGDQGGSNKIGEVTEDILKEYKETLDFLTNNIDMFMTQGGKFIWVDILGYLSQNEDVSKILTAGGGILASLMFKLPLVKFSPSLNTISGVMSIFSALLYLRSFWRK